MNLIFEQSTQNHQCSILPPCDVPKVELPTKGKVAYIYQSCQKMKSVAIILN